LALSFFSLFFKSFNLAFLIIFIWSIYLLKDNLIWLYKIFIHNKKISSVNISWWSNYSSSEEMLELSKYQTFNTNKIFTISLEELYWLKREVLIYILKRMFFGILNILFNIISIILLIISIIIWL